MEEKQPKWIERLEVFRNVIEDGTDKEHLAYVRTD